MTKQQKIATYTSEGLTIADYSGMIEYCYKALAHYDKPENSHHKQDIKEYNEQIKHYNKQIEKIIANVNL